MVLPIALLCIDGVEYAWAQPFGRTDNAAAYSWLRVRRASSMAARPHLHESVLDCVSTTLLRTVIGVRQYISARGVDAIRGTSTQSLSRDGTDRSQYDRSLTPSSRRCMTKGEELLPQRCRHKILPDLNKQAGREVMLCLQ